MGFRLIWVVSVVEDLGTAEVYEVRILGRRFILRVAIHKLALLLRELGELNVLLQFGCLVHGRNLGSPGE
jgi:hypothetical protein